MKLEKFSSIFTFSGKAIFSHQSQMPIYEN